MDGSASVPVANGRNRAHGLVHVAAAPNPAGAFQRRVRLQFVSRILQQHTLKSRPRGRVEGVALLFFSGQRRQPLLTQPQPHKGVRGSVGIGLLRHPIGQQGCRLGQLLLHLPAVMASSACVGVVRMRQSANR